jgi:hypothetical protein
VRFAVLLLALLVPTTARAHALGVEAKLRGKQVEVEAYYSDNTPAREAHVMVHDTGGRFVATGVTDIHGRWQFQAPPPGQYVIVVNAGEGHLTLVHFAIPNRSAEGETVSDGPTRDDFIRFPWGRLALGLATIAAAAVGWLVVRRGFRKMPPPGNG